MTSSSIAPSSANDDNNAAEEGSMAAPATHTPVISAGDHTVPVTVQARTPLSPEDAFRIIVPIDLSLVFTGWGPFPGINGAHNVTGAWDAAGQSRNPDLSDGSTADERLTEYTAPHSFAYEITNFTGSLRFLTSGVRGEWTFTPDGAGTLVRWTYEFKPLPGRYFILRRLVAPLWQRYMQNGADASCRIAEREVTGPTETTSQAPARTVEQAPSPRPVRSAPTD